MKNVHKNSKIARRVLKVHGKHNKILQIFHITGRPMTDREIKDFGKYEDMNEVRPRISELLTEKYGRRLIELPKKVIDAKTRLPVRQTRLARPEETKQPELF